MLIIGLTGNIATGKSEVASMFREMGAKIIDADRIAREVVEKGSPAWKDIVGYFGEKILNKDGSVNRKTLGEIVFRDPKKLSKLNEITHPRIMEAIKRRLDEYRKQQISIVIIEAALIVEKGGMKDIIDKLVVVTSDRNDQISRLMKRDGISREDALYRIRSQMPISEKTKHADYVIDNSKTLEYTRKQVSNLMEELVDNP